MPKFGSNASMPRRPPPAKCGLGAKLWMLNLNRPVGTRISICVTPPLPRPACDPREPGDERVRAGERGDTDPPVADRGGQDGDAVRCRERHAHACQRQTGLVLDAAGDGYREKENGVHPIISFAGSIPC